MYIEPNSNIKIYHNVPLDNTYNHTLYFSSLAEQNTYFHAKRDIIKYNFTAQSYQLLLVPSGYTPRQQSLPWSLQRSATWCCWS